MSALAHPRPDEAGDAGAATPARTLAQEIGDALSGRRTWVGQLPSATSAAAGVPALDYSSIERGDRLPTADELTRILAALDVARADFLDLFAGARRGEVERLLAGGAAPAEATPAAPPQARAPQQRDGDRGRRRAGDRRAADSTPPARSWEGHGAARRPPAGPPALDKIPVTISYFRACLAAFFKLTVSGKEFVFHWSYADAETGAPIGFEIKVYTSIDARSREARPAGEDAIRVVVFDERSRRKVEAWSCTINRVGAWPLRVSEKVGAAINRATWRPKCPDCEVECVVDWRQPPGGTREESEQFWCCPNYLGKGEGCQYRRRILPLSEMLAPAGRGRGRDAERAGRQGAARRSERGPARPRERAS